MLPLQFPLYQFHADALANQFMDVLAQKLVQAAVGIFNTGPRIYGGTAHYVTSPMTATYSDVPTRAGSQRFCPCVTETSTSTKTTTTTCSITVTVTRTIVIVLLLVACCAGVCWSRLCAGLSLLSWLVALLASACWPVVPAFSVLFPSCPCRGLCSGWGVCGLSAWLAGPAVLSLLFSVFCSVVPSWV